MLLVLCFDLIDHVEDCDGSFFGVLCEKAFADEVVPLLVVDEGEADNSGTSFSVFSLFLLELFAKESPLSIASAVLLASG